MRSGQVFVYSEVTLFALVPSTPSSESKFSSCYLIQPSVTAASAVAAVRARQMGLCSCQ